MSTVNPTRSLPHIYLFIYSLLVLFGRFSIPRRVKPARTIPQRCEEERQLLRKTKKPRRAIFVRGWRFKAPVTKWRYV